MFNVRLVVASALAVLLSNAAVAQQSSIFLPNDELLLRQQQRDDQLRRQLERKPDVHLQAAVPAAPMLLPQQESPCFVIGRIVLRGDDTPQWAWLLDVANQTEDGRDDPVSGRCVGSTGMAIVLKRMQGELLRRGWVTTRALAESQDLSGGTLAVTIIPGRIRSLRFAEGTPSRATMINAMPVKPGDVLNLRTLEQGLENFKRVPSADVDLQIVPSDAASAGPGDSDVIVRWSQAKPFRLNLSIDDAGTRMTGRRQAALSFSYDHWLTLNDLFYVSASDTLGGGHPGERGNRSLNVHYSLPLQNWLLSVNAGNAEYLQTAAGASGPIVYGGDSRNADLSLGRLLYRDSVRKTSGNLRLWIRESASFVNGSELVQQRRRTAGWELSVSHRELFGDATVDGSLAWRRGTGAADSLRAPEEFSGTGTSRLEILRADALLSLPFRVGSQSWRYGAGFLGQWNFTPLAAPDRFAIGSRYTVRGFDGESLLIGNRGWVLRQDLGWSIAAINSELYAAIDTGVIGERSAESIAGHRLTGMALGLRGGRSGFSWDAFVGHPLDKPEGFRTARVTTGFYLSASF